MTSDVRLSVIYVNYNTTEVLLGSLRTLRRALASVNHEVIVVDNASKRVPLHAAAVEDAYPGTRILRSRENVGFGQGNNLGAAVANGRYLWILNTDTLIPEDHRFETVLRWLDDHDTYGAALPLLTDADGVIQDPQATRFLSAGRIVLRKLTSLSGLREGRRISDELRGTDVDVEDATAAALVVRSDAYRSVGGFSSEFFFYFEDADLCRKLHHAGWAIRHVRSSWVIHLNGASVSDPHQRKLHYYDGLDLYFKKWHGPTAWLAMRMMALPMRWRNRVNK